VFALALVLSVVGLGLGPALVALGRGRALVAAVIEGLTLGLVPFLIVARLLPHVMEELGLAAAGLALAGYVALWLIERKRHDLGDRIGQAVIIPTLALHALSDGAGLSIAFAASREHGSAGALVGLAIVMHRIPEGLFIATRLLPALGWSRTLVWLGLLASTTVAGALAGHSLLERVPESLFDAIVAFGLGAMLRMVMHAHSPMPATRVARAASGLAFLFGIAVALAIPSPDSLFELAEPQELSMSELATPLFVRAAPAALIGLLAAALVRSILAAPAESALGRGSPLAQAARGVKLGLASPSYGGRAVPLLRRLLDRGAPPAAAVGLILGAVEIDIAAAALAVPLLGAPFAIGRVAAGCVISVVVAVIVSRIAATSAPHAGERKAVGTADLSGAPGAIGADNGSHTEEAERAGHTGHAGHAAHAAHASHAAYSADAAEAARPADAVHAKSTPVLARVAESVRDAWTTALDHVGAWYIGGLLLASSIEATLPRDFMPNAVAPVDPLLGAALAAVAPLCPHGATPIAAVLAHKGLSLGATLAFLTAAPGASFVLLSTLRQRFGLRAAAAFAASVLASAAALGLLANAVVGPASFPDLHAIARDPLEIVHLASAALLAVLLVASLLRLGPREWLGRLSADLADPHVGCHAHASHHDHARAREDAPRLQAL
jgi:uncharacterized membrane protein YraQ (UPF0718 family)